MFYGYIFTSKISNKSVRGNVSKEAAEAYIRGIKTKVRLLLLG